MNYGLYLSAGGALSSMHRQDVIANNLANLNTVGFKPETAVTRTRLPERLAPRGSGEFVDPHLLLERLGGGVLVQPTAISFRQGDLITTNGELDLAIEGDGFFVVARGNDPSLNARRLTRDGRLTLSPTNVLVMAGTGLLVLDVEQQPIRLNPEWPLSVRSNGQVVQNGAVIATLALVSPQDSSQLTKEGDNLLRPAGAMQAAQYEQRAAGRIAQGMLENSAVDPVLALNAMIDASKDAQMNLKMMQYNDHVLGQTINTMGRVA